MTEPPLPFYTVFARFSQSKGMSTSGAWGFNPGGTLDVLNPANGHEWSKVLGGVREDSGAAIDALEAALPGWGGTTAVGRARPLLQPDA